MKKVDNLSQLEIKILLADDDKDDCDFFKDALHDMPMHTRLTTVHDGQELMQLLAKNEELYHVLFLDLNMPRKNGIDCLEEIKLDPVLKTLPVIVFSTSFDVKIVNKLYEKGAHYYICKPVAFSNLIKVIQQALILITQGEGSGTMQPHRDQFVLSSLNSMLA